MSSPFVRQDKLGPKRKFLRACDFRRRSLPRRWAWVRWLQPLIMQKSVVESAGQRTHIIPSPTCNPIRRQSSRALRLIPARDPLAYLSRLGGRCREVALRASAFGAGVDLEPMWAPKRRNNHRQAHFIATRRTVRAADLSCDPRCHDSLRSEPFPHKRPLAMVTRYVGTRCMARAKE